MADGALTRRAYAHLQKQILTGALPPGRQVSEASLAREIGISRTPVREAVQQLEREGLLTQVPRYGTVVRTPRREDLVELYELREGLEGFAAGKAAASARPPDVEALAEHLEEMRRAAAGARRGALDAAGLRRLLAADLAFHLALLRAAGNGRIVKIVSDSRLLTRVFGARRQERSLSVVKETVRQHARILAAVRRRDPEGARRAMVAHVRASRDAALAAFDRRPVPGELIDALDRIELEEAS